METEKYREWMTTSHYEALPAEEAEELAAHLRAHPEEQRYQDEVAQAVGILNRWPEAKIPLDADAVLAAAHPQPAVVAPMPRPSQSKGWSWRRGTAVAASFAVGILAWTQGVAVEVGGHRLAFNVPAARTSGEQLATLQNEIRTLVASEVNAQINPKMEQMVANVNEIFGGYQSGIDLAVTGLREEHNSRLRKLEAQGPQYVTMPPNYGNITEVRFNQSAQ